VNRHFELHGLRRRRDDVRGARPKVHRGQVLDAGGLEEREIESIRGGVEVHSLGEVRVEPGRSDLLDSGRRLVDAQDAVPADVVPVEVPLVADRDVHDRRRAARGHDRPDESGGA
jgi:hypothetical protein